MVTVERFRTQSGEEVVILELDPSLTSVDENGVPRLRVPLSSAEAKRMAYLMLMISAEIEGGLRPRSLQREI